MPDEIKSALIALGLLIYQTMTSHFSDLLSYYYYYYYTSLLPMMGLPMVLRSGHKT